jgi:hypothetical protein
MLQHEGENRTSRPRSRRSLWREIDMNWFPPDATSTDLQAVADELRVTRARSTRRLVRDLLDGCRDSSVREYGLAVGEGGCPDESAAIGNWLNEGGRVLPSDR